MQALLTPRLSIHSFCEGDADFIVELLNDADWLRFIGDKQVRTPGDARRYLREGPIAMVARHGHGLGCVERRSDGQALGMCGLIRRNSRDDVEIGFAFLPAARGQGHAREAAAAVLDFGFEVLKLRRIVAITDEHNAASARVLEAIGLHFERWLPATDAAARRSLFVIDR